MIKLACLEMNKVNMELAILSGRGALLDKEILLLASEDLDLFLQVLEVNLKVNGQILKALMIFSQNFLDLVIKRLKKNNLKEKT